MAEVKRGKESGAIVRKAGKERRKGGDRKKDGGWDKVMERWKNWKRMGGSGKV